MQLASEREARAGAGRGVRLAVDDAFDVAFAGEMARLESYNKHHYRPNSYLHKWWARRCGSTFRLILKHLVADDARRDYYAAGGLEGKVVLDPMMGGGTTLHEAIRIGASVVGIDVDPIPVLQARASLTPVPLQQLERAFGKLYDGLQDALGHFWRTQCPQCEAETALRFVLYGARRHCTCGPAIVVDSLVLRYERRRAKYRLCARCHAVLEGDQQCACRTSRKLPLVKRQQGACRRCGEPYEEDASQSYYARYAPLAVAGQCEEHGLFFASPGTRDLECLEEAEAQRRAATRQLGKGFDVESGPKARDLLNHGIGDYRDLFSSRQLLYLAQARRLLPQFEETVRLNLALLISTSLEFNSMLCGYKGGPKSATGERPGAIRHAFSYHGYSFPYTALENNVLFPAKASGTLQKLFHDRLRRAQRWAQQPRERLLDGRQSSGSKFVPVRGERDLGQEVHTAAELTTQERAFLVRQGSATSLPLPDESVDFVVTDPPYYDNVQYSDLAAFFRVWLPALAPAGAEAACQWRYDLSQVAVDESVQNGNGQYRRVLGQIFKECRRVLKAGGRLIFTFHHWKPQGWAALTLALKQADFRLVNCYVVHSENPISVHVANLRAITDDAILVLAPSAARVHREWERPAQVDKSASAPFCRDCGGLLGWLLGQEMEAEAIERVWGEALRGDG